MTVPMGEEGGTVASFDGTYGGASGYGRPTVTMSAGDSIRICFRKGMSTNLFTGRASRSEHNWYILFYAVINFAMVWMAFQSIINDIASSGFTDDELYLDSDMAIMSQYPIFCLILLPLVIAGIGVQVRRLHDLGYTGWVVLLGIVPMIGQIAIFLIGLVCMFGEGQGHENKYGPVPTNIVESLDPVTIEAE
tara:strand:+ start:107 stop:682 length:576 start_codon:yes stop_codon:yes gene_type:complete